MKTRNCDSTCYVRCSQLSPGRWKNSHSEVGVTSLQTMDASCPFILAGAEVIGRGSGTHGPTLSGTYELCYANDRSSSATVINSASESITRYNNSITIAAIT
jgi:hypothetical protein